MKQLFSFASIFALLFVAVFGKPIHSSSANVSSENEPFCIAQSLIGEIASIDANGGKVTISTNGKITVTIIFNEKTSFWRVQSGQTSLANAEQISVSDIKIGDRVLIPSGSNKEQTPVLQFIIMARKSSDSQREQENERRRARMTSGRVTGIDAEKKELTIQTHRSGNVETVKIITLSSVNLLRYAPDSLKISDAATGSFSDFQIGDQIRVNGERSADGSRIIAEEIISGAVYRFIGIISEINAIRGELIVKNLRTGQMMKFKIGKKTTFKRITAEIGEILKQLAEAKSSSRASKSISPNRSLPQLLGNLPVINVAELKKGDAIMLTATGADNLRLTAVSAVTGAAELQAILQRTHIDESESTDISPGLPGNISGGNTAGDDEP